MSNDISDEMLTAYLDGELSDAEARKVAEAAARDAAVADRLAALDVPLAGLKPAFDSVLSGAPKPVLAPPEVSAPQSGSRLAVAAALVVGIGLGALWPTLAPRDAGPDWKQAVADYQVLYVPETLAMAAPEPAAATTQLEDLSSVLGRDLALAQDAQGLEYRRGQVLGLDGAPLIQLAYVGDADAPFAICITPVEESDYAPTAEEISGLAAAHWVSEGYGFLVIGGDDLDIVESIAQSLAPVI